MALIIKKNINIKGIQLTELYIRLKIVNNINGKNIEIYLFPYFSKLTYKENQNDNLIMIDYLPKNIVIDYDKNINGNDIISYSHEKVKEYLTNHNIMEKQVLSNDNTSNYTININSEGLSEILDESKNILYKSNNKLSSIIYVDGSFYEKYSYFEPTEVTIVDLD